MSNELILETPSDIAPQTASLITEGFTSLYQEADLWRNKASSIVVSSPEDKEEIKAARECRLALKNIRVNADKKRKAMKDDSLRLGRAIDGAYNMLEHAIKPIEQYLEEQEKIAERIEEERRQALRESRIAQLREADPDHIQTVDALHYSEADFIKVIEDIKTLREVRIERQKREEQERIEAEKKEAEERERIRIENEKLKAEAEAREREIQAEREKMAKEKAEAEKKANAERAKIEAQRKAEAEARERAEKEAREIREAQIRKEEAEKQAELKRLEEAKKAEAAPDKEKLMAFANEVRALKMPTIKAAAVKSVAQEIESKIESFAKWIESQASKI